MARAKKNKPKRRRDTAISITGLAEGLLIANAGSQAAFNTNAWEFLTAGTQLNPNTSWTGQGTKTISLKELIAWPSSATGGTMAGMSQGQVVMSNLKENWMNAVISAVVIPVSFRVSKRLLRRPIAMGNKLLKQGGLRGMVKI